MAGFLILFNTYFSLFKSVNLSNHTPLRTRCCVFNATTPPKLCKKVKCLSSWPFPIHPSSSCSLYSYTLLILVFTHSFLFNLDPQLPPRHLITSFWLYPNYHHVLFYSVNNCAASSQWQTGFVLSPSLRF